MNDISNEMIEFREKYILSQKQCAKLAEVSLQTWNQVEVGRQKPSRLTASKIRKMMQTAESEVAE